MRKLLLPFFIFIGLASANGEEIVKSFTIKYISAEHAYIAGGRNDSLNVGDTLKVVRDGQTVAALQITFVADNSSSCVILYQNQPLAPGDEVIITRQLMEKEPERTDTSSTPEPVIKPSASVEEFNVKPGSSADIHGRVAIQVYHYDDKSTADLDLTRPTLRLNLAAENLGGKNIGFNLRVRSRRTSRSKDYNGDVDKNEWRNKIYEMSFNLGGDKSRFALAFGRIIPRNISGIGFIDGALFESNLSELFKIGLFAGAQPQWQYAEFQTSLQKYGAFVNFKHGDYSKLRFESSLALAAEYHSSTVSREFVYFRNFISINRLLRFYQTADIDINRDWRKDKTGNSLVISNFYLSVRSQLASWISTNLSYDNRQNYLTYDTRTIDERLFDGNTRRGFKGDLYLKLPGNVNMNGGLGYRKRESENEATYLYSGGLRKSNITKQMFFIGASIIGFSGEFTDGLNFSARLGKYFRRGDQLTLNYGIYRYKYAATNSIRRSSWFGFDTNLRLYRRYYLFMDYQYNLGDDLDGQRILAEVGYRF